MLCNRLGILPAELAERLCRDGFKARAYYGKMDNSGKFEFNIKELNEKALNSGIKKSSVSNIKTILYFWTIKSYI
ncbi:MAG: hypothetical protein ACI4J6_01215 [Oscillospiraceae bacterium]